MNAETFANFVRFQQTGTGFDAVWRDIAPFADRIIRRRLGRHLVRGWKTADDLAAIDDITQDFARTLLGLAAPEAPGRFDPVLAGGTVDGLRRWLFRILENATANYCRTYRAGGRGRLVMKTFTDLELNAAVGVAGVDAVCRAPLKLSLERRELHDIVNDCVAELPRPQRRLYEMRFVEGLSQRDIGRRLRVSATGVCRGQKRLLRTLRRMLEARGIDAGCLFGEAA